MKTISPFVPVKNVVALTSLRKLRGSRETDAQKLTRLKYISVMERKASLQACNGRKCQVKIVNNAGTPCSSPL